MLPSFEDSDSSRESIIPPPMDDRIMQALDPFAQDRVLFSNSNDEATVDTVSNSSDDSDISDNNSCYTSSVKHQHTKLSQQQASESGSLFVTSPRSFLLGDAIPHTNKSTPSSQYHCSSNHKIPVW